MPFLFFIFFLISLKRFETSCTSFHCLIFAFNVCLFFFLYLLNSPLYFSQRWWNILKRLAFKWNWKVKCKLKLTQSFAWNLMQHPKIFLYTSCSWKSLESSFVLYMDCVFVFVYMYEFLCTRLHDSQCKMVRWVYYSFMWCTNNSYHIFYCLLQCGISSSNFFYSHFRSFNLYTECKHSAGFILCFVLYASLKTKLHQAVNKTFIFL